MWGNGGPLSIENAEAAAAHQITAKERTQLAIKTFSDSHIYIAME